MSDTILNNIEDVFSIIPSENLRQYSEKIWHSYLHESNRSRCFLKWIEFDHKQSYQRCGVTALSELSTSYLSSPDLDEDVKEMMEVIKAAPFKVGQVIRQEIGRGCYWFVPFNPSLKERFDAPRTRVLMINEDVFQSILDIFNSDSQLTPAEKRIIYQLFVGLSVKQAAFEDGVKPDTKREQLKGIYAKLNCSGQSGLVRLISGQLVNLIYVCDMAGTDNQVLQHFINPDYGGRGELVVKRLPNGNISRYFDCGPKNGPLLSSFTAVYFRIFLHHAQMR